MSYEIEYTGKIKKDIKLAQKRGLDLSLFKDVIIQLEANGKLPSHYKPHILKGNYKGLWECHIQPDWLLIWKQDEEIKLISLTRTGTHSDLF
jgi:mRNA interferase YafQ